MTRLLLVRHARPVAGFGAARDPGLDDVGRAQAEALVEHLREESPMALVTSPLRRARETAAPLAGHWGIPARVAPAFGEIPAPAGSPGERAEWLRALLPLRWGDVEPRLVTWRTELLGAVTGLTGDAVVVTHFVAINTVVGHATGDDRLVSCTPGHTSITDVVVEAGSVTLRAGPSA
jgi:broad specificity phosphatase PhoE